ncbi:MAG TPA: hypothetical protein V6D17_06440 [Candidatus Obscuribacterales bacterium]
MGNLSFSDTVAHCLHAVGARSYRRENAATAARRYRRLKAAFVPAIVALALFAGSSSSAAPAIKKSNWRSSAQWRPCFILHQKTRAFGDQVIYIADDALKIKSLGRNATTVSHAPFKKVVVFDDAHRTFYETSPDSSQAFVLQRMIGLIGADSNRCRWVKAESGEIAGLKAERYVADDGGLAKRREAVTLDSLVRDLKAHGFWVASDLPVSPAEADVLARLNGMPPIHKVPLRFVSPRKNKRPMVHLDTVSFERGSLKLTEFNVPYGYKRVPSEFATEPLDLFAEP